MLTSLLALVGSAARASCDGDGTLDPGEECDDGNLVSCDGCSAACELECDFTCHLDESWLIPGGSSIVVNGYIHNNSCAPCEYFLLMGVNSADLTVVSMSEPPGWGAAPIPGNGQLDFTMTISGSATMDAWHLHQYSMVNDGEAYCEDVAFACPVPAYEYSIPNQWIHGPPVGPLQQFEAQVQPITASWVDTTLPRRVRERFFSSEGSDTCHYPYPANFYPNPSLTPNPNNWETWDIVSGNYYRWDYVGWDDNGNQIAWYRGDAPIFNPFMNTCIASGRNGIPGDGDECVPSNLAAKNPPNQCGFTYTQHMQLYCPNLPGPPDAKWVEFEPHPVSTTIYPTDVGAARDTITLGNFPYP